MLDIEITIKFSGYMGFWQLVYSKGCGFSSKGLFRAWILKKGLYPKGLWCKYGHLW